MYMKKTFIIPFLLLYGCSSQPPVSYQYYRTKAVVDVSLTKAVTCDASKTPVYSISKPEIITHYSADSSQEPLIFDATKTATIGADSSSGVTMTSDGRLKGINSSSHGHGEEIITGVVAVVKTILLIAGGSGSERDILQQNSQICDYVKRNGKNNIVQIRYYESLDLKPGMKTITFNHSPDMKLMHDLNNIDNSFNPQLAFKPNSPHSLSSAKFPFDDISGYVGLPLQKVYLVNLQLMDNGNPFAATSIVVPGDDIYIVPVPKAALFGDAAFTLVMNENGLIDSISYTNRDNTAGAITSLNSAAAVVTPDYSRNQETKRANDEIQLRKALNDEIECKADPKKCG